MKRNPELVAIGKKIRGIRKLKKIRLKDLPKMCKVNYTSLSYIENGYTNARILTFKAIANALDVDVIDFL